MKTMRLLLGGWENELTRLVAETRTTILLLSPFISMAGVTLLRPYLENGGIRCRVITRNNWNDFLVGASDHRAIRELMRLGATVKTLQGLHAKVYVFDTARAVVTSANLTAGGLAINHEWGLLVERAECGEVFTRAEALWGALRRSLTLQDISRIEQGLERHRAAHPAPEVDADDRLPDEGERLIQVNDTVVRVRSSASADALLAAIEQAAGEPRIAKSRDFQRLARELAASGYQSISVRSFLWLIGWCNTGWSYAYSSEKFAQPFARALFGYVPDNDLLVAGERVSLRNYRYRHSVLLQISEPLLARHHDQLVD